MKRGLWLALGLCVLGACSRTEPLGEEAPPETVESPLTAPTGSMVKGRSRLTLTRLLDGRVLAVGGGDTAADGASAELYDPTLGTWSLTGSLNVARSGHFAVLLPSGRVLISGGSGYGSVLDLPDEIYDPATGTFTVVGPTVAPAGVVVGLSDGRVLEARGGTNPTRIFDETTGTHTPAASMINSRGSAAVALLQDGRVLVAGGMSGSPINQAEVYNPATNTWSAVAGMSYPRAYATATVLPDGRVLVAGGYFGGYDYLSNAEIYNPATNTWVLLSLTRKRSNHVAALTSTGKVYLFGGSDGSSYGTPYVDWVDPVARNSSSTGQLQRGRRQTAIAPLGNGRFLLAGGLDGSTPSLSSAELYTECTVTTTCADMGASCGWVAENCGGSIYCGNCASGLTCSANTCVCTPKTCRALGKTCGTVSDSCGGTLECGTCGAGASCTDNVCTPFVATYDSTRKAPACSQVGPSCDSGLLLDGRAGLGPEQNSPNTLGVSCSDGLSGYYHSNDSLDRLVVTSLDGGNLLVGQSARIEATAWVSHGPNTRLDLYAAADVTNPSWTLLGTLEPVGTASGAQKLSLTYTLPLGSLQAVRGVLRGSNEAASPCTTGTFNDHDDLVFPVTLPADVTAPTASLTAPTSGQVLKGSVTLTASATDDRGVTKVEFLDGTVLLGTVTASPWNLSWNTLPAANGSHTLSVKAYDAAGNVGTSTSVTVTVDNDKTAPTVSILSPIEGETLSGSVTLKASATDNVGVNAVSFYDGTTLLGTLYAAPHYFTWNTTSASNGTHSLTAKASDAAGNVTTSTAVTVTLANDKTAPTVSLTAPAAGATLTGTVTLTASASDNVALARVEFFDGSTKLGTVTGAGPTYSFAWNTTTTSNGSHTLKAVAVDTSNNSGTSATVSVTVSNVTPGLAVYDATRKAPTCGTSGSTCDSGTLLDGRASMGPERNAPNTINSACADGTSGTYHSDESLDRLKVTTLDGTPLAPGKTVRIEATVWAYSSYTADKLDLYYTGNAGSPSWLFITTLSPTASGKQTLTTTYTIPAGSVQAVRGLFRYGGSATGPCVSGSYNDHDDLVFVTP